MDRRTFLVTTPALLAAGCVSVGGAAGPPMPAPVWRVGDRWVYNCSDGFRLPVQWVETHEVTAVDATGIAVRRLMPPKERSCSTWSPRTTST